MVTIRVGPIPARTRFRCQNHDFFSLVLLRLHGKSTSGPNSPSYLPIRPKRQPAPSIGARAVEYSLQWRGVGCAGGRGRWPRAAERRAGHFLRHRMLHHRRAHPDMAACRTAGGARYARARTRFRTSIPTAAHENFNVPGPLLKAFAVARQEARKNSSIVKPSHRCFYTGGGSKVEANQGKRAAAINSVADRGGMGINTTGRRRSFSANTRPKREKWEEQRETKEPESSREKEGSTTSA